MLGMCIVSGKKYMVMEFMPLGSLSKFIQQEKSQISSQDLLVM
jgi:hypothetical protein